MIYNLEYYSFSQGEQVLLDTNIWLYLFPAPVNPRYKHASQYSTAFNKLIDANAQPVMDHLVLSEYLNVYCRTMYNANYQKKYNKYKMFRMSNDFTMISGDAVLFARKILDLCQRHFLPANELDLHLALEDFESGKIDFNDSLLIDICKKNNFKLMTNDGDFQNKDIVILTTNPILLRNYS